VTTFCGDCGAALYSRRRDADFVFLRVGSANQRALLPPKAQGFCASAMPWAMDIRDVPQIPPSPLDPPGAPAPQAASDGAHQTPQSD
jgi:hypothetical protein